MVAIAGAVGAFLLANAGFIASFALAAGFSYLLLYFSLPFCPVHIKPMDNLNVPRFRGEWYEMYKAPIGEEYLGRDCGRYQYTVGKDANSFDVKYMKSQLGDLRLTHQKREREMAYSVECEKGG